MSQSSRQLKEFLDHRFVVVVDPSTHSRDSLRRFLNNMHVKNIKLVVSAEDARRELITTKVGFFISEWILPDKNGLEFCRTLRQKKGFEHIPFLLMTSEDLRKDVVLASEAGIDGYLLKPFSYDEFSAKILQIVKSIQNPSAVNLVIDAARNLLSSGEMEQAEELYRESLLLRPDSARALVGMGAIDRARNDIASAIAKNEQAIAVNPDYLEAYSNLVDLYHSQNNTDRLVEVAEKAYAISPDNPKYTLVLAKAYFDRNRLEESEMFFRKTILLSPKLAEGYKGLGYVFYEKKEYDKAIKNFKKALDLAPNDISLLNSLGLSSVRRGFVVQGIDYYKLALTIDARDWRVLFNIGFALEKIGNTAEALEYLERALAANPTLDKARRRIDWLKKNQQKAS